MAPTEPGAERLLVLIPAYNEEANLPRVIAGIRRIVSEAPILVVDDCSSDGTAGAALLSGARVVRHPVNLGYGAALLTGYRYARREGFDRLVQMDGDGQHDPSGIRPLLEGLDRGADLVLGSRFRSGARKYRAPWTRKIGMVLFSTIASAILRKQITDATSGFQALSGRMIRYYASGIRFPQDYPDADLLILVGRSGFRIEEVAVDMHEKPGGSSIHSGLRPLYYVVKMLLSILLVLSQPGGEAGGAKP